MSSGLRNLEPLPGKWAPTEKQRTCKHEMVATIFTCKIPVPHQDHFCTKCRYHKCEYHELLVNRRYEGTRLDAPVREAS